MISTLTAQREWYLIAELAGAEQEKNTMYEKKTYQDITELPLVMAPTDVAAVLRVSKNTAYEIFHSKSFPTFRVGKQYRVHRDSFMKWMQTQQAA